MPLVGQQVFVNSGIQSRLDTTKSINREVATTNNEHKFRKRCKSMVFIESLALLCLLLPFSLLEPFFREQKFMKKLLFGVSLFRCRIQSILTENIEFFIYAWFSLLPPLKAARRETLFQRYRGPASNFNRSRVRLAALSQTEIAAFRIDGEFHSPCGIEVPPRRILLTPSKI